MRTVLGILMIIASVVLGLYFGLWVFFIGGIIDIVHQVGNMIDHEKISEAALGWGIAKVVLASTVGVITFYILLFGGIATLSGESFKVRRRKHR